MKLWQPKRRIEQAYQKALNGLLQKSLGAFIGARKIGQMKRRIDEWVQTKEFDEYAHSVASTMITNLFDDVGDNWREASEANGKSRRIYELLMEDLDGSRGERVNAIIKENAEYIKTLPSDVAEQVSEYCKTEALKGRRPEDIEKDIQRMFPSKSKARAKLIARTECAKAQTALVQSDAEEVGADWYIWRAVTDQRTRSSHSRMNGIICRWDDPPNPEALFPEKNKPYGSYHPGCTFNCRCHPEPIVTKYQLTENTYKVCINGRIVSMNKGELMNLMKI